MRSIAAFLRDDSGVVSAEYALMLGIIGAGVLVAVTTLAGDITTALDSAGGVIAAYAY